jgi:hypothetical protein
MTTLRANVTSRYEANSSSTDPPRKAVVDDREGALFEMMPG